MLKNKNKWKVKKESIRQVLPHYKTSYKGVIWLELQAMLPPKPTGKLGFRSELDVKQPQ